MRRTPGDGLATGDAAVGVEGKGRENAASRRTGADGPGVGDAPDGLGRSRNSSQRRQTSSNGRSFSLEQKLVLTFSPLSFLYV